MAGKHKSIFVLFLNIIISFSIVGIISFSLPDDVDAQSNTDEWTQPINLSQSGGARNPQLIVDSEGILHAFWEDIYAGYVHIFSNDGVDWSPPVILTGPFSYASESPLFFPDNNGHIHVFWIVDNELFYSRTDASNLPAYNIWERTQSLATSVIAFDIDISAEGVLHFAYLATGDDEQDSAGVYYIHTLDNQYNWTSPINLYQSQYLRSLAENNSANIDIAVSTNNGTENMFITWDNRPRERIFLAESDDGGNTWNDNIEIDQSDEENPKEFPNNIQVVASDTEALILWQVGQPEVVCEQRYQKSSDQGVTWSEPETMLSDISGCPNNNTLLITDNGLILLLTKIQNQSYILAWDGDRWSDAQPQPSLSYFEDPETFNPLLLDCQHLILVEDQLYMIGCDSSEDGDIWLTSRTISTTEDWFPSPSIWSSPTTITESQQPISSLTSIADNKYYHLLWGQSSKTDTGTNELSIQYARWDGDKWSNPTPIITGLSGTNPQLAAAISDEGRLSLTWVNQQSGDLLFSWAIADRANFPVEWVEPTIVPSPSSLVSSPDILIDANGKIAITYAVLLNENRGIYIVESDDFGKTWTQPLQAIDAIEAEWDLVDQPKINLTADGRLHLLFTRYTLQADQRFPQALLYSQSINGGVTWTEPEEVSNQPEAFSEIFVSGEQMIHRVWQENRNYATLNFDQVSKDSGLTWEEKVNITGIINSPSQVSITSDPSGDLYFIQIIQGENLLIQNLIWDGSSWKPQEQEIEQIRSEENVLPSSITASITSEGNLNVSSLVDDLSLNEEERNRILNMYRSIELPQNTKASVPAILATPGFENRTPVALNDSTPTPSSENQSAIEITFTPSSQSQSDGEITLTEVNDSNTNNLPITKTAIGIIVIVTIIIVIIAVFWIRQNRTHFLK